MPPRVTARLKQPRKNYIRAWREAAGLSQDQLVARAREHLETFSKSTLSRIENGSQAYTQPMLEALALALGRKEPADLLIRDPRSEVWTIWDTVRALPADEQAQIAQIVATFRKAS